MRIGVDLDGVVANFTKGWTEYYEEEFGKKILEADIKSWGLSEPLTHFKEDLDFWKWARGEGCEVVQLMCHVNRVMC